MTDRRRSVLRDFLADHFRRQREKVAERHEAGTLPAHMADAGRQAAEFGRRLAERDGSEDGDR